MELKGSKTEKNLEAVFARESQSRNKYTYFADVAKEKGFDHIGEIFLEAAGNEKEHARRAFGFLNGIGDTEANLKAAAEDEHSEWTEIYPDFERIAREEKFTEIADFFKRVAKIEGQHEKRYLALLKDVQRKVLKENKEVTWKCRHCGWFEERIEAPEHCPVCRLSQSSFGVEAELIQTA